MYSYKLNNSYTVYVNCAYLNECIKASRDNSRFDAKEEDISATSVAVKNTANIGSKVSVLNLDTQKRDVFTITSSENINVAKGVISYVSPIGHSLLGHGIGDTVIISVPAGTIRYKIIDLRS